MITIYGTESCSWCAKAKVLCERKHLAYEFKNAAKEEVLNEMHKKLGVSVRTVPQIFDSGNYIGGYTDFEEYVNKNILLS